MDVLQGLPQARQLRALEERGGQPVRQILGGRLLERRPDELAEPALSEPLGRGVDRGQVLIGARRGRGVGAPVLGVHDLEALQVRGALRRNSGCGRRARGLRAALP